MLVADEYLGHCDDPAVASRLADADPHRVVLSDADRRRSRVRTETAAGRDLGIVVGRVLEDGDVLQTGSGAPVVVELAGVEALVIDLDGADVAPTAALELGHTLGNRHRDLAVRGREALVPVVDSRERAESLVEEALPEGVPVRRETVPPATFDDGHSHAHSHDEGATHAHAHDGDTHAHEERHVHGSDSTRSVEEEGS